MRGVEEIPRGRSANIYFSSLYQANPTLNSGKTSQNNRGNERSGTPNEDNHNGDYEDKPNKRKRVNYNIQQIQAEQFLTGKTKAKSLSEEFESEYVDLTNGSGNNNISIAELRRATRRFDELNRENYNENIKIEIPKSVTGLVVKRNTTPSPAVKRFIISKKTWNNYLDELNKSDIKLITTGSGPLEVKPNALQLEKLCTICGGVSYSSCIKCKLRVCSVKCQHIHDETRCTHFS